MADGSSTCSSTYLDLSTETLSSPPCLISLQLIAPFSRAPGQKIKVDKIVLSLETLKFFLPYLKFGKNTKFSIWHTWVCYPYVSALHVCSLPLEVNRGFQIPWIWITGDGKLPCGCWKVNRSSVRAAGALHVCPCPCPFSLSPLHLKPLKGPLLFSLSYGDNIEFYLDLTLLT